MTAMKFLWKLVPSWKPLARYQGDSSTGHDNALLWLIISGLMSWSLYVALVWLSGGFAYEIPGPDHPLLPALGILYATFVLYLGQIVIVFRGRPSRGTLPAIVVFAVAFRVLLLFSEPIQEVDAYRYLWDGKVTAVGVNPFRYSPHQVLTTDATDTVPEDLTRLVLLRDRSSANAIILARVHFGSLTSVYPPVSQAVFAIAAWMTPPTASVATHLLVMKIIVVLFDLATLWSMIKLLRFVGRPVEWAIVYAWCPLVLKEFANSGHLDSIAVFFTTAAILCFVKGVFPNEDQVQASRESQSSNWSMRWTPAAVLLLSLGIGAKIYPIVLAPLMFVSIWRRIGRREAILAGILVSVLTSLTIAPMMFRDRAEMAALSKADASFEPDATGLATFAAQWQMNDFLFLIAYENLVPDKTVPRRERPPTNIQPHPADPPLPTPRTLPSALNDHSASEYPLTVPAPWFVVTSQTLRVQLVNTIAQWTTLQSDRVPFQTSRLLTSSLFLLLALRWALRIASSTSIDEWLHGAFLTIAWFWLLQPTQNPWYWTWALPLVPFARSRAWLVMSGLVLMYYARFWFAYHPDITSDWGPTYEGANFFDFVVTWIEYGPWFVWLALEGYLSHRNYRAAKSPDESIVVM